MLNNVVLNRGISFGLASSNILSIALVAVCIVLYVLTRRLQKKYPVSYGLLMGAVVSNLFDRFVYGGVRDVFRLPFIGISNNLADWMILGALIVIGAKESKIHHGLR
ncbi:MAG TPA: signal peptidase II [Patescibacteria group bacterium]|nr:signal peptidase II [Patescibacteria group bacterium]